MKMIKLLILAALAFSIANCCPYKEKLEKTAEIGAEAVSQFAPPMAKNIMTKVSESGYENAVEFCAGFASDYEVKKNREILASFKEKYGIKNITIKRTSLKLRNPNNSPDVVEKEIMTHWESLAKDGKEVEPATKHKNGVYYSLAPIRIISPVCLGCHGDDNQRDKKAYNKILSKYPNDKAIGYNLNDLRGAVSVTIEF
jgi:hypothetical protein